ncbi:hypothetical protein BJY00DRAFT_320271 [Aspergillus carlsbadensis]|nr:hypothetical protein BJY00DRAFT_320271 [Aspergillus carlsbadensis]
MSLTTSPMAVTATAAQLLLFTTPFSEPDGCHVNARRTLTQAVSGTTSTQRYLISDPALPSFTSCQPSGWNEIIPESRFSFSPAVCPSGWATWEIGTTTRAEDDEVVTTAWCCSSDYHLYPYDNYPLTTPGFSKPCTGQTSIAAPPGSAPILHLHHPWHITWHASDASGSLLTPAPPTLTAAGQTIRYLEESWADSVAASTGTGTTDQSSDGSGPGESGLRGLGLTLGLGLGLGLGGGLLLVGVCLCFCRCRGTRSVRVDS